MSEPYERHEQGGFLMTAAGQRLFHFLHGVEPGLHPEVGVVVCAPLSGERSFSQRSLVGLGRHLAAAGLPTLRYDCTGTGDSEGDEAFTSLASQLGDTSAAIGHLMANTGVERVVLFGLQYGALLARLVAGTDPRVKGLVLVDPVVNGADCWTDLLRGHQMNCVMRGVPAPKLDQLRQLPASGVVEAKGEAYSVDWVRELQAVDLRRLADDCKVPQLLVRYDLTPRAKATADDYATAVRAHGVPLAEWVDEGPSFWTERSLYDGYVPAAMYEHVLAWLQERLP